jgi:hypothetical protein
VPVDFNPSVRPLPVIRTRVLDGISPVVSSIFDMQGYNLVEFLCHGGAWTTGALASILVEHGELSSGADMAAVPDSMLYRTEAAAAVGAANAVGRVGYRAATGKRYVRVTATPSGVFSPLVPTVQSALVPTVWTVLGGALNGSIIDTDGFKFADFVLAQNNVSGSKWVGTFTLQHGDAADLSDATTATTPITDVSAVGIGVGTGSRMSRIGYRVNASGAKRYVRPRLANAGADAGSVYVMVGCDLINLPASNPSFGVLGLFHSVRSINGAL